MKTRLKGQGCLTIQNCLRKGTSTESWAGYKTSTWNSQRTTPSCTHPIVSSLMDPRTITISSTIPHLRTRSSSAKTLHKAPSPGYQTSRWHRLRAPQDSTSAVDPCMRLNPSLEVQCMLHHSFLIKTKATSTELWETLRKLWRILLKSHSWGPRSIPKVSARRSTVRSWVSTWRIDHTLCRKISKRKWRNWQSVSKAGMALSSLSPSTMNRFIPTTRSDSNKSE